MKLIVKIIFVIVAFLLCNAIFSFIVGLILQLPFNNFDAINFNQYLILKISGFPGGLLIIYLFRKNIDKKSFLSMGLIVQGHLKHFFYGFFVSTFIIVLGAGVILLIGKGQIKVNNFSSAILLKSILLYTIVAIEEELLMRGYILSNLLLKTHQHLALLMSSILFAAIHVFNVHISFMGFLNLFLIGMLLGAYYIYSNNLMFPVSFHLFWNLIQGPVLGFNVSGHTRESVFNINMNGEDFLTGGGFGFEGSIICTIILIIAIFSIAFYTGKLSLIQNQTKTL